MATQTTLTLEDVDIPAPINWRTAGRQARGTLFRGSVEIPRTTPSIPTKYITLFNPKRPKFGFMNSVPRFKEEIKGKIPDPGAYYKAVDYNKQSDSFSKRGFGNLASRA
ncbi:MAG: hypothetical protein EZS28_003160 [Streblomastix strix]|uniref:Uncharacterized protein n=1 Tax=Streblomastix strix TaxID=222440 RepID=A0A5J4X3I5_9EUKA|nr:MAG: hypothetical protein EZS28_003160 [Streblomastix strix]